MYTGYGKMTEYSENGVQRGLTPFTLRASVVLYTGA